MQDIKEVSLGFAEFVSQLIRETYDAILSSQNYQLEKYAELEAKKNLSNEVYIQNYISDEQIEERIFTYFGFEVLQQMQVDEEFKNFIIQNFDQNPKPIHNKKLTKVGFNLIADFISNMLVEEQKSTLGALLNHTGGSSLIVDSGEINAKLELTSLYSKETNEETPKPDPISPLPQKSIKSTGSKLGIKKELSLPNYKKDIKVFEYKSPDLDKATILIDKKSLQDINDSNVLIPAVRLSAQPAKMSSSSNLFSEIKINFKTV